MTAGTNDDFIKYKVTNINTPYIKRNTPIGDDVRDNMDNIMSIVGGLERNNAIYKSTILTLLSYLREVKDPVINRKYKLTLNHLKENPYGFVFLQNWVE